MFTQKPGGLSQLQYGISSHHDNIPSNQNCITSLDGRQISDITYIHLEDEVFLKGNFCSLKHAIEHTFRGLIGLIVCSTTLGFGWWLCKPVRSWTACLLFVPIDLLNTIPLLGNKLAAIWNRFYFNRYAVLKDTITEQISITISMITEEPDLTKRCDKSIPLRLMPAGGLNLANSINSGTTKKNKKPASDLEDISVEPRPRPSFQNEDFVSCEPQEYQEKEDSYRTPPSTPSQPQPSVFESPDCNDEDPPYTINDPSREETSDQNEDFLSCEPQEYQEKEDSYRISPSTPSQHQRSVFESPDYNDQDPPYTINDPSREETISSARRKELEDLAILIRHKYDNGLLNPNAFSQEKCSISSTEEQDLLAQILLEKFSDLTTIQSIIQQVALKETTLNVDQLAPDEMIPETETGVHDSQIVSYEALTKECEKEISALATTMAEAYLAVSTPTSTTNPQIKQEELNEPKCGEKELNELCEYDKKEYDFFQKCLSSSFPTIANDLIRTINEIRENGGLSDPEDE